MIILINLILTTLTVTFNLHARGAGVTACLNCTCISEEGKVISADCSHRGWREVPKDLPPTLITLSLSCNLVASLPGSSLVRFPRLERLDLSGNVITKLENESFRGLSSLRWLSLRSNWLGYFPDTFPEEVFQDLSSLTFLNIQNQTANSSASAYPDSALRHLRSLKTLKMDGLENSTDLGPGFAGLQELEELEISDETGHCAISKLSETFFASINTSRPLTLNLTDCKLRNVHNMTFSFLPTLHNLDLFECRHLHLPGFIEASKSLRWTQIKVLNISHTHRKKNVEIKAEYFQHLGYTWLEHLRAEGMAIYTIDLQAIFNLPTSLKYLSVFDNHLINATFLFGVYLLPHLETLQISQQNHHTSLSGRPSGRNGIDFQTKENRKTGLVEENTVRVHKGSDKATSVWKKPVSYQVEENQNKWKSTSKSLKPVSQNLLTLSDMADKQNSSLPDKAYTLTAEKDSMDKTKPTSISLFHADLEDLFHTEHKQKTLAQSARKTTHRKLSLAQKGQSPLLGNNRRAQAHQPTTESSLCPVLGNRNMEEKRLHEFILSLKSFLLKNPIWSQRTRASSWMSSFLKKGTAATAAK